MIERTNLNRHHDPALKKTVMPRVTGDDAEGKRRELLDYFRKTYAVDEALYDTLRYEESFYPPRRSAATSADFLLRPHRRLLRQ